MCLLHDLRDQGMDLSEGALGQSVHHGLYFFGGQIKFQCALLVVVMSLIWYAGAIWTMME